MGESTPDDDEWVNSICAVYAHLIENELDSDDPDIETIREHLAVIKKHCIEASFPPGETPDHLEAYQYTAEDA